MKKDEMREGSLEQLGVNKGEVLEITSMKELGAFLGRDEELLRWWRGGMGYLRDKE
jgi:hypothetical protein